MCVYEHMSPYVCTCACVHACTHVHMHVWCVCVHMHVQASPVPISRCGGPFDPQPGSALRPPICSLKGSRRAGAAQLYQEPVGCGHAALSVHIPAWKPLVAQTNSGVQVDYWVRGTPKAPRGMRPILPGAQVAKARR